MSTKIPASHRDLLSGDFATLATLGEDGFPQVTEVWFLSSQEGDEDVIRISLNTARQKTKNLSRVPQCSIFFLDTANPYRYLEIRGEAEISPDDDYVFADAVGAKYSSDLRLHDSESDKRVVVRLRPTKVNAVKMRD
jgi:PPOX class probable F420-dependent enzyme